MPAFRITNRQTGTRIGPASIAADDAISALSSVRTVQEWQADGLTLLPDYDEVYLIERISEKPDLAVFTVVVPHREPGRPAWELSSSGSRDIALRESSKAAGQGHGQAAAVVEESREVNRGASRERRS